MRIETKFRDLNLTKLKLSLETISMLDQSQQILMRFYIVDVLREVHHIHIFKIQCPNSLGVTDVEEIQKHYEVQGKQNVFLPVFNCLIDLIMDGKWMVDPDNRTDRTRTHDCLKNDKYAKNFRITKPLIKYSLAPLNIIRQNRMVQKSILHSLFFIGDKELDTAGLTNVVHIPKKLVESELAVLEDLDIIRRYIAQGDRENIVQSAKKIRLSAKGRQNLSESFLGFGRSVFIILRCHNSLEWYDKFVIEELKKHGYEGDVQEKKEPKDEIRRDMIERIESCAFVIADLTGGRENCLYELGYAHALHKRSIITRKKKEVEKMTTEGDIIWKTTFDINQYKLTLWEDEQDEEFKSKIRNSIEQTIKLIEQDFLS